MGAIFVVPFAFAASVLLDAAMEGLGLAKNVMAQGVPPPPAWLNRIPAIGARLTARWQELSAGGAEAAIQLLRPYVRSTAGWAMQVTGGFAMIVVHFVLTIILVAILYSNGEAAARGILMFAWRIGSERAVSSVYLAARAVRGVALGVVVTAFIQSVIAGIGLMLAGVPRAGLLVAIVFVLCIAQIGPLLVLVPALVWLFASHHQAQGIVLTLFTVVAAVSDNFLKPVLIRRGVDLPLLLIIPGVIGGMLAATFIAVLFIPLFFVVTSRSGEWVRERFVRMRDRRHPQRSSEA